MKTGLRHFLHGVGSVFNVFPAKPLSIPTQTDAEAIASDWKKVGDAIQDRIEYDKRTRNVSIGEY